MKQKKSSKLVDQHNPPVAYEHFFLTMLSMKLRRGGKAENAYLLRSNQCPLPTLQSNSKLTSFSTARFPLQQLA